MFLFMAKRLLFIVIVLSFTRFNVWAQQDVSFSIQAHEDDWQLFMSSKIVADLTASGKVVFITLTAGDAGNGDGAYSGGNPFYLSREMGSVYSAKFAADITSGTTPLPVPTATIAAVNGHNITKYIYGNTVSYFLRLPDGDFDGNGFPITGNKSLQKLRQGNITSLTSVENSATYTGWSDLTNTIKQIILNEKGTDNQVWMYTASLDNNANPGDHSDHLYAAHAGQDAVSAMLWVGIAEFVDYASTSMPANLSATDHENAAAIFMLSEWGITEKEYASSFVPNHTAWLPMDYFAVKRNPSGNAPFTIIGEENIAGNKMTSIPMIVSITSPVYTNKDVSMIISPFEKGTLHTTITDEKGNNIFNTETNIENKDGLLVNMGKIFTQKGRYILVNTLNGKYIETRKIIVQ